MKTGITHALLAAAALVVGTGLAAAQGAEGTGYPSLASASAMTSAISAPPPEIAED